VEGARANEVIRSCSLPEQLGALGHARDRRDNPGEGGEAEEVASITEAESIRL